MKQLSAYLLLLLLFSGCSFKLPPNQWQIQSAAAFESYTKNFLSGHDALAQSDLKRSIEHAKKSADLETLARIYLGSCALNISVGLKDGCENFVAIQELIDAPRLYSYYALLQGYKEHIDPSTLGDSYATFARMWIQNETHKAYAALKNEPITSKLVASALIKTDLTQQQKEELITEASFYGYKKAVLFWLHESEKTAPTEEEKNKLRKKREILSEK